MIQILHLSTTLYIVIQCTMHKQLK